MCVVRAVDLVSVSVEFTHCLQYLIERFSASFSYCFRYEYSFLCVNKIILQRRML